MKRLFAVCMMLLIALPFSGCGGSVDEKESTPQNSKETTKAVVSTENTTERVTVTESITEISSETEKPTNLVPATVKPAEENSDNKKPEENNSADEEVSENTPVVEGTKEFFVDTEYYTLTIPESWDKDCIYEIHRGDNNAYSLIFYDKASHEEIGGGKLLTVRLLPDSQEYTQYPSYDVLGSIKVDGVGLNAVVIYPTDVQFSPNTAEKYREHQNEVPDVVATISFKDGYDFSDQPL